MSSAYQHMFKLLIVGESGVGKTCMLLRFAEDRFDMNFLSTIGIDFKVKDMDIDDKKIRLQIWDSAGQERFRNITTSYYRNTSGIIIVYDITVRESFEKVTDWLTQVRGFAPTTPLMLIGNKCDLESSRQVTVDEGKALAARNDLIFLETSAFNSTNIELAFTEMTRQLLKEAEAKPKASTAPPPPIPKDSKKKGCSCN